MTISDSGASVKLLDSTHEIGNKIDSAFKPPMHSAMDKAIFCFLNVGYLHSNTFILISNMPFKPRVLTRRTTSIAWNSNCQKLRGSSHEEKLEKFAFNRQRDDKDAI